METKGERGDEEDEEEKKKKGMKMRQGRAAVKETDWKKGRMGNRRGKKEDETKVCVCVLACKTSHCDEAD